jgi:endothelin-converting enzyme
MVEQDASENVWPPWPWPPWDGDGDDKEPPPINWTERAHKLAKNVLQFETQIADASLDL